MAFGEETCVVPLTCDYHWEWYSQANLLMVLKQSSATFSCPSLFDVLRNRGLSLSNCFPALLRFKSRFISRPRDRSKLHSAWIVDRGKMRGTFTLEVSAVEASKVTFKGQKKISRLWILVTYLRRLHGIWLRPSAANVISHHGNGLLWWCDFSERLWFWVEEYVSGDVGDDDWDQMGCAGTGAISSQVCLRGTGQERGLHRESIPPTPPAQMDNQRSVLTSNSRGTWILELHFWLQSKDKHTQVF